MEIFIDSANTEEINKWQDLGVVDGVTTNPSIMLKDGILDIKAGAKKIAGMVNPFPVSVEVTTNKLDEMLSQAREMAAWAPNIVIKIPQETQDGVPCYGVMRQLERQGIKVNATAALSMGQVILSAKVGATYISIFGGRVGDEGGNVFDVIKHSVEWLQRWQYKSKVIVGSIRSAADALQAAIAGAHIITIPPQFLSRLADHQYTRETVRQFISDANSTLLKMKDQKSKGGS